MAGKRKPVIFPVPRGEHLGKYDHLGKPYDAYTYEDIKHLGLGVVEWMQADESRIWLQGYFTEQCFTKGKVDYLRQKYPQFAQFYEMARLIQEERLVQNPFWKRADGGFAKFILSNRHDDWRDKAAEAMDRNADASLEIAKAIATGRNPVKE